MTWSYSGDPSNSELDKYRFAIGDTKENNALFQDEEILYVIKQYKDSNSIMLALCNGALNIVAGEQTKQLGPQMITASNRYKYYLGLRDKYVKLQASSLPMFCEPQPSVFNKNMMENDKSC